MHRNINTVCCSRNRNGNGKTVGDRHPTKQMLMNSTLSASSINDLTLAILCETVNSYACLKQKDRKKDINSDSSDEFAIERSASH